MRWCWEYFGDVLGEYFGDVLALIALGFFFFFFVLLTIVYSLSVAVKSLTLLPSLVSVEWLLLSSEESILITSRRLAFSISRWSIVDS